MNVHSNADKALEELDRKMKLACEMIGSIIEGNAKSLCPVDTGLLRNSITHGATGGKLSITEYEDDTGSQSGSYPAADIPADTGGAKYVVVVGTNVHYAPYQELGAPNAGVPPAPYLRPAFEGSKDAVQEVLDKLLKK